jgi:hypothetical protein
VAAPGAALTPRQNPYKNMSDSDKTAKQTQIFNKIAQDEGSFITNLQQFIKIVVDPLSNRDTSFKRNFMADASIAVSFSLLKDIFASITNFQNSMKLASNAAGKIQAHAQFAPSLLSFAQYASENASCLNSVKGFGKQIREFCHENPLPNNMTIESVLVSPLEHYSFYCLNFQEIVWTTPESSPDKRAADSALEAIQQYTGVVDEKLNELAASVKLLSLQAQCKYATSMYISPASKCAPNINRYL